MKCSQDYLKNVFLIHYNKLYQIKLAIYNVANLEEDLNSNRNNIRWEEFCKILKVNKLRANNDFYEKK